MRNVDPVGSLSIDIDLVPFPIEQTTWFTLDQYLFDQCRQTSHHAVSSSQELPLGTDFPGHLDCTYAIDRENTVLTQSHRSSA